MPYRTSLLFAVTTAPQAPAWAAARSGGWSEGHWSSAGLTPAQALQLGTARSQLLPKQCTVIGFRQQAFTLSGNRLLPGGTTGGKFIVPGNPAYTVNLPQDGLQISTGLTGGVNAVRFTIRALPDEVVADGEFNGDANFRLALGVSVFGGVGGQAIANGSYLQTLNRLNMGAICRDLSQANRRVLGIALGGVVTLADVAGLAVNDYVRFHRVKDTAGATISGTFRIAAVAAGPPATITLSSQFPATVTAFENGTLRKDLIVQLPYSNQWGLGATVVKKIGVPSSRYRGRRSVSKAI